MGYYSDHLDCFVSDYDDMQAYFYYPEIRELIRGSEKITKLVEKHDVADMAYILTDAEAILEEKPYSDIFPDSDRRRTVDLDKLAAFLETEFASKDSTEICSSVSRVTSDGKRKLNQDQAYEVLLFSALFAYVQKTPDGDDEAHLLKLLKPLSQDLMLELIQNNTKDTMLVSAEDSPLRRHLAPGEQILALTAGGETITFLPRICALEDLVMCRQDSKLVAQDRDAQEVMSLDGSNVRIFSRSDDYGLLAADKQGIFIKEYSSAEGPDGEVFWLRGDQDDYGFLLADGSYQGRLSKSGWNNLLFFDLCSGGAIAVTRDRTAIDESGNVLGENAAAVSCCTRRWIILRLDGSVVTDQGDLPITEGPGRAVCADAEGYWVSTDEKLLRIENGTITEEYEDPMDEIWQDNFGATVCGLGTDGSIRFL